jgi:peptidoglycan/xylan/chitin deacetylase (PgdA/CDA1 family)
VRAACRGRRSRRGNANAPDGSARRWRAVVVLSFIFMGCQPRGVLVPEGDLLRDLYFRGSPAVSTVALTFDDGPNGRCTEAVLDALAALHAPATFFVLGKNVATAGNEGLLGRMVREGHVIGVHGYWHGVRRLFWQDVTEDDIRAAMREVGDALGRDGVVSAPRVRFFRPPFGFLLEQTAKAARRAGVHVVEWSVSVHDWRPELSGTDITKLVLEQARPGDVILLHDGDRTLQRSAERCVDRQPLIQALPMLVPALRARGLEPVPLAQVLGLRAEVD